MSEAVLNGGRAKGCEIYVAVILYGSYVHIMYVILDNILLYLFCGNIFKTRTRGCLKNIARHLSGNFCACLLAKSLALALLGLRFFQESVTKISRKSGNHYF